MTESESQSKPPTETKKKIKKKVKKSKSIGEKVNKFLDVKSSPAHVNVDYGKVLKIGLFVLIGYLIIFKSDNIGQGLRDILNKLGAGFGNILGGGAGGAIEGAGQGFQNAWDSIFGGGGGSDQEQDFWNKFNEWFSQQTGGGVGLGDGFGYEGFRNYMFAANPGMSEADIKNIWDKYNQQTGGAGAGTNGGLSNLQKGIIGISAAAVVGSGIYAQTGAFGEKAKPSNVLKGAAKTTANTLLAAKTGVKNIVNKPPAAPKAPAVVDTDPAAVGAKSKTPSGPETPKKPVKPPAAPKDSNAVKSKKTPSSLDEADEFLGRGKNLGTKGQFQFPTVKITGASVVKGVGTLGAGVIGDIASQYVTGVYEANYEPEWQKQLRLRTGAGIRSTLFGSEYEQKWQEGNLDAAGQAARKRIIGAGGEQFLNDAFNWAAGLFSTPAPAPAVVASAPAAPTTKIRQGMSYNREAATKTTSLLPTYTSSSRTSSSSSSSSSSSPAQASGLAALFSPVTSVVTGQVVSQSNPATSSPVSSSSSRTSSSNTSSTSSSSSSDDGYSKVSVGGKRYAYA